VFPGWERSIHAANGERLRNATLLSIAPTGTLSVIAGTSGGIEPLFALAYRRRHTLGGAPFIEVNPLFERWVRAQRPEAIDVLAAVRRDGTLAALPGLDELRARFVTATEIAPARHLAVQHAFQRHVDNAVAKTINLPATAGHAEVAEAYREAWRLGLKGVTISRCGTKESQVLSMGVGEEPLARELFAKCDPGAGRL
jgi:ribonucleoside-diphosphate reductase alpha chain